MFKASLLQVLATTVLFGLMVGQSQTATAQSTGPSLEAKMTGNFDADGEAAYFESKTESLFMVSIERWKPGTTLIVTIQRGKETQKLAWLKTDRYGRGGIKLSSSVGKLPRLQTGDRVQLWYGRTQAVSGRLRSPR